MQVHLRVFKPVGRAEPKLGLPGRQEQRKRFLERIDEPEKNWKFSNADIEERKFWKHYMKASRCNKYRRFALVCRPRRR
jgi:hypothetical protein